MRYLLLIIIFTVTITIKLLSTSTFLQKPALARPTLQDISSSWKISQEYIPPDRGAPPSTQTGGTRGAGQCLLFNQKLTLLVPETRAGLTTAKNPTLYVYIPPYEKVEEAVFFFTDADNNEIYESIFQLPEKAGIIQIKVPEKKLAALELGKSYTWGVQIVCNSEDGDQSGDPIVEGIIKRIIPEQNLSNKLTGATPLTLPNIYASEGIWYDALESMVQLLRLNPENTQLMNNWQKLFNSANSEGKEIFLAAPLLECCELKD